MENNESTPTQEVQSEGAGFSFVSEQEVAQAQSEPQQESQPEPQSQPQQETYAQPERLDEAPRQEQSYNQEYSEDQINGAVFSFLSEKLGREVNSYDDLTLAQQQEQRELDERIGVIADFVEKTGRDPRDWFVYQSLDPSEMDDMTAIQVQMTSDYPNLSQDEINTLLSSKYKVDSTIYSEEDVKLSALQMKIDAENARKSIDELRTEYQAPERAPEEEIQSPIDDQWIATMRNSVSDLRGIEFDLGNGNSFTFGLENDYKNSLVDKNARLDEFFDPYVDDSGSWDFDRLNMHRAVVDNIQSIVRSAYRQGQSDGQRGIVDRAANVTPATPNQGGAPPQADALSQQLREALLGDNGMKFL